MKENIDVDINAVLHFMLGAALIEIRASNSMGFIKKMADIFHNLPFALSKYSTAEEYDACLAELMNRARRFEMENYVEKLQIAAIRAVQRKANI
ncbi:hypothetical protein PQU63_11765 [Xanthomonas protegens]|uniref:Uncharacterized protein n=1 Tax=Xanthomonas protegens TaxID=3380705 RepID=A0ABU9LD83_9XANT|nr:hypothetical protein [Xanthomonas sp. NCPPB 1128]